MKRAYKSTTATDRLIKSFAATHTKVLDASAGLVEAVFSVTGLLDRQGDIIDAGAFKNAITNSRLPTLVYAHQWDNLGAVLGKTQSWRELLPGDPMLPASIKAMNANRKASDKGYGCVLATLKFELETQSGRDAFTHVRNKNLEEYSFAFDVAKDGAYFEEVKAADGSYTPSIRHIKDISEVFEITLCVIGANPATSTVSAKAGKKKSGNLPDYVTAGIAAALLEGELHDSRQDHIGSARPAGSPAADFTWPGTRRMPW